MIQRYLLCTGNPGKATELRQLLPPGIELATLAEAGLPADLPETGDTLEANALQKARYAHERTGMPCIADDTGLEVDALDGAPGVHSARYAGEAKDPAANMARLLRELHGRHDRTARFRTVIALVGSDGEQVFEGEVRGTITDAARGTGGFGYDPVFLPEMSDLTFAELDAGRKNAISHRGRAVRKLVVHIGGPARATEAEGGNAPWAPWARPRATPGKGYLRPPTLSPVHRMRNLVFFGHHKCASTWMTRIFHGIQSSTGLRIAYGHDLACEINLHINARREHAEPYPELCGVHLIRDPRDVVVSGYYSHLKTHPTANWKALYELRERLNKVPMEEGLYLEIDFLEPHFTDMYEWDYGRPGVLELRYEEITARPHLDELFKHLGFLGRDGPQAYGRHLLERTLNKLNNRHWWPWRHPWVDLPLATQRGIVADNSFERLSGGRRTGQENTDSHYRKGVPGDWRRILNEGHQTYFNQRYGDLLQRLGYAALPAGRGGGHFPA